MYSEIWTKEFQDLIANFEKVTGQRPALYNHDCFSPKSYKEYLKRCDINEEHPAWQENEELLKAMEEYKKNLDNNK